MQVDPEQLRALASSMDRIGAEIDALNVRSKVDEVGPAMQGSPLGGSCSVAGEFVEGAWLRMAMRCARYSNLARGSASTYAVTDQDFRDGLTAMG
ncbi:hypothetical protein G4H71_08945 [Rhodococcus triatomae]|nr:type VII secretion target [Rhodococcus triatomae]QNG20943.1 hypothetical protein G4H72_21440 [Rhodococcus triatomae]QNG23142.1 hypothetical protein G4H71_08945 [Rhodococcus triatomae]